MHKKITIIDVAKAANVSITTVSRALSNKGRVSKATREKIVELAKEMNFEPSALATGFIKSKTNNIGIIVPTTSHDNFYENIYFQSFLRGVNDIADKKHYDILLSAGEEEEFAIQSFMNQQKSDGLILMRAYKNCTYIEKLKETGFPFVIVGDPNVKDIHVVDADNYDITYNLMNSLIKNNTSNIAFMSYDEDLCVTYDRYLAYKQALLDNNLSISENLTIVSSNKKSLINFLDFFINREEVKCLIVSDHTSFITVLEYIKLHKISIPEQLQLITFNDSELMSFYSPPITSIDTFAFEMGKESAKLLIDILENKIDPVKKIVNCKIHWRESTYL